MSLLTTEYLLTLLLVFVRISGLLLSAPFFGQESFSTRIRVLLGALLAYAMAGFVEPPLPEYVSHGFGFMMAVGIEAFTGFVLGFTAQLMFLAVQLAGEIIGFQMVLGIAQVFDPVSGDSANPMGRILSLAVLVVFVVIDGHHLLLRALQQSFEVVPLGGAQLHASGPLLIEWTVEFFRVAIRLAAPFMISILIIDMVLGIFARLVPQADLFSLSLPLKLLAGFGLAYFFVQNLFPIIPDLIERMSDDLLRMLEAIAP